MSARTQRVSGLAGLLEAVKAYRDFGQQLLAAQASIAVAGIALVQHRFADGHAEALRSLTLAEAVGDRFVTAWSVEWVATAHIAMREAERGAELAGAAEAARGRIGGGWTPMSMGFEAASKRAVDALGASRAAEIMDRGRLLSLDGAVALARE